MSRLPIHRLQPQDRRPGAHAQRVPATRPGLCDNPQTRHLGVVLFALLLLLLPSPAAAWPADDAWIELAPLGPLGGGMEFVADVGGADPALDLGTGTATGATGPVDPTGAWYADESTVWVRLGLDGDPADGAALFDGHWAVLVDGDGDDALDAAFTVAGPDGLLESWTLPGTAGVQPDLGTWTLLGTHGDLASGAVRAGLSPTGTSYALDLAVPRTAWQDAALPDDSPVRFVLTTGDPANPWVDVAGCFGACGALTDALTDPVALDTDGDGRTDPQELADGTDPADADSDDDGLLDGEEAPADSDGDGALDALDCDSDDDGLLDGTEAGLFLAGLSADTDTTAGCWVGDADTTTWPTDPTDPDSDGGGLADGAEDWNHDGAVDPWETDPTDPADDLDTDGDGVADVLELLGADGQVDDLDSDGDGIEDALEGLADPDGDGLPSFLDDDSDGDGLLDALEGSADTDGDGVIDALDSDSDGDGLSDATEGDADTDGDGLEAFRDEDSDGDGLSDATEGTGDYDGDGTPNRLDLDSDNDGLLDSYEGAIDTDGAGSPDYLDGDSDNDGIGDGVEGSEDVDGDGLANYVDANSDGTGAEDRVEGTDDVDCDGVPNFLDPDDEDSFCDEGQPIPGETGSGAPPANERPTDPGAGRFTGGSCSTTPGAAPWTFGLALLALLGRRRTGWLALLLPGSALAQDVDAQRFAPVVDGGRLVKVVDADTAAAGVGSAGLWMTQAHAPLVFRGADGERTEIVGLVDTTTLVGAVGLGAARVGFALPAHVGARGTGVDGGAALGDARLSGEVRAVQGEAWRVGGWADLSLPTATAPAWLGSGKARLGAGAAASLDLGDWRLAAHLGGRSGTGTRLGALTVSPSVVSALGLAWSMSDSAALALELDREDWLGNDEPGAHPAEWLLTARLGEQAARLHLGGGSGLGPGLGAPTLRLVAGLQVRLDRR